MMRLNLKSLTSVGSAKLSLTEKIGYSFGDVASCIFFQSFMLYLLYFYTDVFGITAATAGTMFLVTRIWDSVNDPLMGILGDRTNTRWGKFRPYLLWMALPFGIVGVLTFSTPEMSLQGKIIYAYITYSVMMMVYTAINLPYSALLGVITSDPKERTTLSSYKFIGAFGGGLLIQFFTLPLVERFGKGNEAVGFQHTMILYAAIAVVLFLITFLLTRERVKTPVAQKTPIRTDLKDLIKNKPWLVMFLLGVFTLAAVSIKGAATMYYFIYYVEDKGLVKWFFTAGTLAVIVGILLVDRIARRYGKKKTYMWLMILTFVFTLPFYFLGPEQVVWMFVLQILGSVTMGPTSPLVWAMYADVADYSEWKTGRRATGLIFSAGSFAQKMGWTIGGAVSGWILALYHYEAGADQTVETLKGIRYMMSIYPAIGALLAAIAVTLYNIDEKLVSRIETELKERRLIDAKSCPK